MTDKEFVLRRAPEARCFGPVKLFWPGQGERTKMLVTLAPHLSFAAGEGDTEEEAWRTAAERVRLDDAYYQRTEQPDE